MNIELKISDLTPEHVCLVSKFVDLLSRHGTCVVGRTIRSAGLTHPLDPIADDKIERIKAILEE